MAEVTTGPRTTCVFAFNVRDLGDSPFAVQTPFGAPIAVSSDDALTRADLLETALEAFMVACSNTTYPESHPIHAAYAAARRALGISPSSGSEG